MSLNLKLLINPQREPIRQWTKHVLVLLLMVYSC